MSNNLGSSPNNDFSNFRFPDVNRAFLRGVFWILAFIFLASIFSLAQGIYSRFLQKPEVRKVVLQIGHDIDLENTVLIQRAIIIHNRGNADALNVYIQCSVPSGRITRISVISEEAYHRNASDYADDRRDSCSYSLARLASNAKFTILLWATVSSVSLSNNNTIDYSLVSASYDGGSADFGDKPTALEEMKGIGTLIAQGTTGIARQTDKRIGLGSVLQDIVVTTLPNWGVYIRGLHDTNAGNLRSVFITTLMIMVALWLFSSRLTAGIGFALVVGFLTWLYIDSQVNSTWLVVPLLIAIIEIRDLGGSIRVTRSSRLQRNYSKEKGILIFVVLMLVGVFLFINQTSLGCVFANASSGIIGCLSSIVTISGGLWMGITVFALYFLMVDI